MSSECRNDPLVTHLVQQTTRAQGANGAILDEERLCLISKLPTIQA